jgi:1-deoxy-D-xylulose-5-phosphate reductoisomerase
MNRQAMGDNGVVSSPRDVVVLGSTGSVGTQALEVVSRNPDRWRVTGLAAGGTDPATLARQALDFGVETVAVARAGASEDVLLALYAEAQRRGFSQGQFAVPKMLAGPDAAEELAGGGHAIVLNAITGSIGLQPTLAALRAGSTLALANKESLIVGGPLVKAAAQPGQIVPVDSEHSALAQCLRSGRAEDVRRLILTASGGPFRGRKREDLTEVTPDQAKAHPTWDMGPIITINSATLVNKGLELIEAHLLFDVPFNAIDVVVHPQSIVHSMVEFVDGSTLAQASPPSMLIPIALALSWPGRASDVAPACDWSTPTAWEFEPLDHEAFPAVALAREAGMRGGGAPAVYNAANEVCVDAFRTGQIGFLAIVDTVERVLGEYHGDGVASIDDVISIDAWARARTRELVSTPS